MLLLAWEHPHLLLDRGAVTRTITKAVFIFSEFWCFVIIGHDYIMCLLIGLRDVANDLFKMVFKVVERMQLTEPGCFLITRIRFKTTVVNSLVTDTRWCACSKTTNWELQPLDRFRQSNRRWLNLDHLLIVNIVMPHESARIIHILIANMTLASQKGTSSDDNGLASQLSSIL